MSNAISRLMARIKNIIGIGTITGADTQWLQIKTTTGRTNDRIRRLHNYGYMSRPLVDAKSYNLFIGGVTARGISLCVEDERYQMELQPGEVAMLDDKGNLTHFTEDGIKVHSKGKVDVKAKEVTVTAEEDITLTSGANIIQNGKVIKLNEGSGVITCESICPLMGTAHVDGSTTVMAGKK